MSKAFAHPDAQGRVIAINSDAFLADTTGWVEVDEGEGDRYHHAQGNYLPLPLLTDEGIYRYKLDGDQIQERTAEEIQADIDALPPPPPGLDDITRGALVAFRTLAAGGSLTEGQVLDNKMMFPHWAPGLDVTKDTYYQHNQGLYRVIQPHTTQADWAPDTALSLWARVNRPDEIPAWTQGSWSKGARVTHIGKNWESQVDSNVWEPGAAGVHETIWKEILP